MLAEKQGRCDQADGGCHVASLREIGRMTLTKTENKGKSNRRVYFVLEDPAGFVRRVNNLLLGK